MLIKMPLSDIFAVLTPDRILNGKASFQSARSDPATERSAPQQAPLPDLGLAGHLLLPIAIFITALLTIDFSKLSNLVATIWPVNAIILVAVLRHVRSPANYASIFGGGIVATGLASLASGNSLALCATLTVANGVEVAVALAFLSLFKITASNLTSFRNLLIFIIVAGGVAPIWSAIVSAMAFGAAYGIPWFPVWRNWYPGHALGMIIVAPFLICVTSQEWRTLNIKQRAGEAAVVLASVIAVCIFASYFRSLLFLMALATLFATVRFGLIGATVATSLTALIASAFVVMGIGHTVIPQLEQPDRILALQVFLAITSFWSLPIAALLTERERLLKDLSAANTHLTVDSEMKSHLVIGLRRHLSMAEENERLRLSHELHDQAGQSLIATILELNEIDSLTEGPARERLHLVRKRMEEMEKTLHRIAWELRPPSIDELGLKKALASYIADWGEQFGTEVDFHCDDQGVDDVPNEIGTALYRIVQEGLTNIVKHAQQPSNVSVVIRRVNATLQVIIEDNGCGFDPAAAAKSGSQHGLGLDGMRERLSLIGGTLDIESVAGAGTTLFARVSLEAQRPAA